KLGMAHNYQSQHNYTGVGVHPEPQEQTIDCRNRHFHIRFHDTTRRASMTSNIPPCTLYCQAGATEAKLRSEPDSCMISAPRTVPIGETMPPTNSPPPMMTAPIDRRVRPRPTFASPVVVTA